MLISHEVPISLLEKSKEFNDYDYCLLHLTYENEEYKQFYIDSIKQGRKVLLDNSLFELGDALTNEQLAKGVLELKPTWYVVPDCLNDAVTTMSRFRQFVIDYPHLPGLKIGVAQGSTLKELVSCYLYMAEHADKIAIPFDSKAFDELDDSVDNLRRWCSGRQQFIQYLISHNLWCYTKPHHLLGCSYAEEFTNHYYKSLIESVDTSSPVVCGVQNIHYQQNGNNSKPVIKLCELIDAGVSTEHELIINKNIKIFRRLCNG